MAADPVRPKWSSPRSRGHLNTLAEEASKCRKLIRPSHRHDRHPRLSGYRGGSPGPTRSLPRPHRWIPRRNASSIRGRAPGTREGEREAAAAPCEDAWNRPAKGSIDPGRDLSHEAAPDHRGERGRVPGADAPGVGFLTVDSTHRPVLTRTWVSTPAAGAEPPQPCSAGWPTVGTPVIRVSTTTRSKLSFRPACLPGPAFRPAPIGQPLIVFSRGAASRTRPADLNRTELFLAYDQSADRHPRRRRHRRHLH